jgi:hypothetical protein
LDRETGRGKQEDEKRKKGSKHGRERYLPIVINKRSMRHSMSLVRKLVKGPWEISTEPQKSREFGSPSQTAFAGGISRIRDAGFTPTGREKAYNPSSSSCQT